MSLFNAPYLTKSEEDTVCALHKSVRATHYDDPIDQDTFLVASAHSVLQFREQVASFASSSEIAECVFTIRSAMVKNSSRLENPPDDIFASITDFAGEIARSCQLFRDRKRAQTVCLRTAEGVAARAERREALKYAAKVQKHALSPDDDTVSIPSDDEESDIPIRPTSLVVEPLSIAAGSETIIASPIQALLSLLPELESLMISLQLSSPLIAPMSSLSDFSIPGQSGHFGNSETAVQPASPLSPTPSLSDLVPIVSKPPSSPDVNVHQRKQKAMSAPQLYRAHVCVRNLPNIQMPTPSAIRRSNVAIPVPPRPAKPILRRLNLNYADDLLVWKPKSADFRVRKNTSLGSSKRYKMPPPPNSKPKVPKPKCCYFCAATSHLIASCPLREIY
ncbi:hypothetical protein MVEN_00082500 [Mycena venus]|uniref:Uncharacterized protein n=1 Tax=Mycena venus TaxID=2733690 RepID=A0A8H6ZAM8_9AGAR|nr:hypothetical protein MVEN_00082500 [Mycena venus]